MKKPKVLLDCDGVLSCFNGACIRLFNTHFDLGLVHDDIQEWGWTRGHPKIPPHALEKLTKEWVHEPGFVMGMDVLPGAQEAVSALREVADVVCVTSPWRGVRLWTHERTEWLIKHFGFHEEDIIPTSGKHHVGGDMLVDDRTDNITRWLHHQDGLGFLWAQPYNLNPTAVPCDESGYPRLRRTDSWGDVVAHAAWLRGCSHR